MDERIREFHIHLYYKIEQVELAQTIGSEIQKRYDCKVGNYHLKPVGPHPRPSVQILVPIDKFGDILGWLSLNHQGLTVLAHPESDNELRDHTDSAMWIGVPEKLKLEALD